MGTYLLGQTACDKVTGVKNYFYKKKLDLEKDPGSFQISVKEKTERFEVHNFIGDAFTKEDTFPSKVDKYGRSFGGGYSTQMFKV